MDVDVTGRRRDPLPPVSVRASSCAGLIRRGAGRRGEGESATLTITVGGFATVAHRNVASLRDRLQGGQDIAFAARTCAEPGFALSAIGRCVSIERRRRCHRPDGVLRPPPYPITAVPRPCDHGGAAGSRGRASLLSAHFVEFEARGTGRSGRRRLQSWSMSGRVVRGVLPAARVTGGSFDASVLAMPDGDH